MGLQFIHDVYVNWTDGGTRKHNIPEYHEWNQDTDTIDLMDIMPVLFIEPDLFKVLEDKYVDIPSELLTEVYRKAKIVNSRTKRTNIVDYAFIITDGNNVLAINTEGDNKPNMKSRLIPRQENLVREIAMGYNAKHYDIPEELEPEVVVSELAKMIYLEPEDVLGLTRAEREMKEIIVDCLFDLAHSLNPAEVMYWFVELFPYRYHPDLAKEYSIEEMITKIHNFIKKGWSKQHEDFGTNLVKVHTIFTDDWKQLLKASKQLDKVKN